MHLSASSAKQHISLTITPHLFIFINMENSNMKSITYLATIFITALSVSAIANQTNEAVIMSDTTASATNGSVSVANEKAKIDQLNAGLNTAQGVNPAQANTGKIAVATTALSDRGSVSTANTAIDIDQVTKGLNTGYGAAPRQANAAAVVSATLAASDKGSIAVTEAKNAIDQKAIQVNFPLLPKK